MIGDCCPDQIGSIALGVTRAFEVMESSYRPFVEMAQVPFLPDRGVPTHNVLGRVDYDDFKVFLDHVKEAAGIARRALDAETIKESVDLWRELFGEEFPPAPDDDDGGEGSGGSNRGGFTPRTKVSEIGEGRFA
jgi:hypothetical protein